MHRKIILCLYFSLLLLDSWFLFYSKANAVDQSLQISQVLYDTPTNGEREEWIELYNSADHAITIKDYKLFSKNDADFEIALDLQIPSKTFFVVTKDESAFIDLYGKKPDLAGMTLTLANSGDYIGIKNPAGTILSVAVWGNVIYESWPVCKAVTQENSSLLSDSDSPCHFSEKKQATPWFNPDQGQLDTGEESSDVANQTQTNNSNTPINLPILDARNLQNGEPVTISGIVTTLPDDLSSQYFYIQDDKSGIQIYSYNKDFPDMAVGDKISVTGELSTTYNERRLKINSSSDIKLLSSGNEYEVDKVSASAVGEAYEGRVVQIVGEVTDKNNNTFYIDDGLDKIRVYLKKPDNFASLKIQNKQKISITGIMAQYGDIYRILPRKKEDVIIMLVDKGKKEILPEAGDQSLYYALLISGLIMYLWNILSKILKRHITLLVVLQKG